MIACGGQLQRAREIEWTRVGATLATHDQPVDQVEIKRRSPTGAVEEAAEKRFGRHKARGGRYLTQCVCAPGEAAVLDRDAEPDVLPPLAPILGGVRNEFWALRKDLVRLIGAADGRLRAAAWTCA